MCIRDSRMYCSPRWTRCHTNRSIRPVSSTNDIDHPGMDAAVRGDDLAEPRVERIARERCHAPTRFLDQQRAGRDVPGIEADLPEAVEAPGRDVGEVDGGG